MDGIFQLSEDLRMYALELAYKKGIHNVPKEDIIGRAALPLTLKTFTLERPFAFTGKKELSLKKSNSNNNPNEHRPDEGQYYFPQFFSFQVRKAHVGEYTQTAIPPNTPFGSNMDNFTWADPSYFDTNMTPNNMSSDESSALNTYFKGKFNFSVGNAPILTEGDIALYNTIPTTQRNLAMLTQNSNSPDYAGQGYRPPQLRRWIKGSEDAKFEINLAHGDYTEIEGKNSTSYANYENVMVVKTIALVFDPSLVAACSL